MKFHEFQNAQIKRLFIQAKKRYWRTLSLNQNQKRYIKIKSENVDISSNSWHVMYTISYWVHAVVSQNYTWQCIKDIKIS